MAFSLGNVQFSTTPEFEDFDLINGDLSTLEIVEKSGGGNCFVRSKDLWNVLFSRQYFKTSCSSVVKFTLASVFGYDIFYSIFTLKTGAYAPQPPQKRSRPLFNNNYCFLFHENNFTHKIPKMQVFI